MLILCCQHLTHKRCQLSGERAVLVEMLFALWPKSHMGDVLLFHDCCNAQQYGTCFSAAAIL